MTLIEKDTHFESFSWNLASYVKRLGNPVSTILLDSPCLIFQTPEVDGVIGFQLVRNHAVVLGDPICLPEDAAKLTQAFQLHCQQRNLRIIYFLMSKTFVDWAINNGCHTAIQAANELIVDPVNHQTHQKLRWKVAQSIKEGVVINEYKQFDPGTEEQIKDTVMSWLKEKHGPQIHLGDLNSFISNANKRIFYAIYNNKMIGLLKLVPIDRFDGWSLSASLTFTDAPVGVSEHLISCAIDTLARENCHFLCLGAVSGDELGDIIGLSTPAKAIANLIFKISKKIFKLDARAVYLFKFRPQLSQTYILVSGKLTLKDLIVLKKILHVKLCFQ